MHVLYLSASAELGGGERSLLDILASLRQAKPTWNLRLLCAAEGPLRDEALRLGVASEVLAFPRSLARVGEAGVAPTMAGTLQLGAKLALAALPVAKYVDDLRSVMRRVQPDVVHTNSLKMHVVAAEARPAAPLVWHVHDYIGGRRLTERLLRHQVARVSAIVANSRSVADDVRSALEPSAPVFAVPNAVDLHRFHPAGARLDLDALAGLPPVDGPLVRVGLLGAFGRWKGHTTFLDALARLPGDVAVRAYIIGGPLVPDGRAVSTRSRTCSDTSSGSGSPGAWASRASCSTRRRRCGRSTSWFTRAPPRSRSASSSPRPWRAAAPSSRRCGRRPRDLHAGR